MTLTPLFALLLLATTIAAGANPPALRLVEAGIICPEERNGEVVEAPGTELGYIELHDHMSFDLSGRVVPAVLNISFGLRVELKGDLPADVQMVTLHPPMGADGVTRQSYDTVLQPGNSHVRAFSFDFPHEIVPGTWTLSVEQAGVVLLSVDFDIVDFPVSDVDQVCGSLLST